MIANFKKIGALSSLFWIFFLIFNNVYGNSFPWPKSVFEDQFESGDVFAWTTKSITENKAKLAVVTNPVCSGSFALKCSVFPGAISRRAALVNQIKETSNIWFSSKIYFSSKNQIVNNFELPLLALCKKNAGAFLKTGLKFNDKGKAFIYSQVSGQSTNEFTYDTWHQLQIHHKPGSGDGQLSIWLDGAKCYETNELNSNDTCDEVRVGIIHPVGKEFSNVQIDIFFDDITVNNQYIDSPVHELRMRHPDFRARIGSKVIAILTGQQASDIFEAYLMKDSKIVREIIHTNAFFGKIEFSVNLRDLPSGLFVLRSVLKNKNGDSLASADYEYFKAYPGNPRFSIDENNNFTTNDHPFFLITPFVLNPKEISRWKKDNLYNVLYGCDWGDRSIKGIQKYLHTAANQNALVFPTIPYGAGAKRGATNELTTASIMDCVKTFSTNSNVAGWAFIDEPELYQYSSRDHYQWWSAAKEYDGTKIVHLNLMGDTFGKSDYYTQLAHTFCYPYLCADSMGFDIYPYEYPNKQSLSEMVLACQYARAWNYDLIPITGYVQTQDVHPGQGGGAPSPQQIEMMAWLLVVNGAKGIQWFHYFGETPESNKRAMANFKRRVEQYASWILEGTASTVSFSQEATVDKVLYGACWSFGDQKKLFCVNTSAREVRAKIYLQGLTAGSRVVDDETGRDVTSQNGFFEEEFLGDSVRIYSIDWKALSAKEPLNP